MRALSSFSLHVALRIRSPLPLFPLAPPPVNSFTRLIDNNSQDLAEPKFVLVFFSHISLLGICVDLAMLCFGIFTGGSGWVR